MTCFSGGGERILNKSKTNCHSFKVAIEFNWQRKAHPFPRFTDLESSCVSCNSYRQPYLPGCQTNLARRNLVTQTGCTASGAGPTNLANDAQSKDTHTKEGICISNTRRSVLATCPIKTREREKNICITIELI